MLPKLIRLARQGEVVILTQGQRRIPVARFEILTTEHASEMQVDREGTKPSSNEEPAS